jgi:hypothetical protein
LSGNETSSEPGIYEAVVVQYLQIDFYVLELNIVDQRAYRQLPENLIYYHAGVLLPEVVLAKLHHGDRLDMHLISLRMNEMSIRANASISEHSRCRTAQSLSLDRKGRWHLFGDSVEFSPSFVLSPIIYQVSYDLQATSTGPVLFR